MTRIYIVFTILLLTVSSISAQDKNISSIEIDHRLLQVYDLEYLERLQENHPKLLERLNFYLDHSYTISVFEKEEQFNSNKPEIIEIESVKDFNILLFLKNNTKVKRLSKENKVYKIKGSNDFLFILSGSTCTRAFNRYWLNNFSK